MIRRALVSVAASALVFLGVAVAADAATPMQLLLPQATAFSILGVSCGGIQEQAYATGFDPSSGYPTGVVQLSTRCGGSGRGGGYKTTTYTGSAGVTWDFTGTVVSSGAAPAVTVNPTLAVYDSHGNEVYNQSGTAYLSLAPGFVPVARVTRVTPAAGPATGGTTVTITGNGFTGATGVRFGAVAAKSFTIASTTTITAVSPAAGAGTVDVTVVNGGGASATAASDQFAFVAVPSVTAVSPKSGSPAGGMEVTITGLHLGGATRVSFGGAAAAFSVNSDTSITATSPYRGETGAVDVSVTSPGGTSTRTTADRFSYTVSRPVVAAVSPSSGPVAGGSDVTIAGSSLSNATEVDFGGVPAAFTINDDSSITAVSPFASPGTVDVTVVSYGLRSTVSTADRFTYAATPPVVTGGGPGTGPETGGELVLITGMNLLNTVSVAFGDVSVPFAVIDDGTVIAASPAGSDGTVDVTVTTDVGTSAMGAADQFTIVPPPVVSGVSPAVGSVDGGTSVTITGADLADATEVDFGGIAAAFSVNDDGSLTATAPPGASGTVDVTVSTNGGTSSSSPADQFTYE